MPGNSKLLFVRIRIGEGDRFAHMLILKTAACLPTASAGKVLQSVESVRLFVSTLAFQRTSTSIFTRVSSVMTIGR